MMGSIPVGRALDKVVPTKGKIFLPDQDNDPTLIQGAGTDFENGQFQKGGLIVLPKVGNQTPSTEIAEVLSATQLRLKKPFKTPDAIQLLTQNGNGNGDSPGREPDGNVQSRGCTFKVAPHVDQSKVYNDVFNSLEAGEIIGIFPEGGSHDRTDLLPLKPGVAIMALGALAKNPECGVKIIPIGMNYFHAHKFRSRAVIEFGHPIEVHPDQVEAYKAGDRRNAVGSLLETVVQGLRSVTQSSPDYDTLMLIQAARRLYNPWGKKLPLPLVVELNRPPGQRLHRVQRRPSSHGAQERCPFIQSRTSSIRSPRSSTRMGQHYEATMVAGPRYPDIPTGRDHCSGHWNATWPCNVLASLCYYQDNLNSKNRKKRWQLQRSR